MEFILKRFFGEGKETVPILPITEEYLLPPVGPFSRVEGTIMRSKTLSPDHYGDAIWRSSNGNATCVIDTSAPHHQLQYLGEADMVNDLLDRLPAVFDGTPLNPSRLLDALNAVLTSNNRDLWRGQAEFGLSIGGIYCGTDQLITGFNIGTGALYINGKMEIAAQKEFHNPYPMPGSKAVKNISPTVLTLPLEKVMSVTICTDGIDFKHYLPTSKRPITEFIAPRAGEATILKLER